MYKILLGLSILFLLGAKITSNVLQIGRKQAEDIKIEFDIGTANNPVIQYKNSAGKLQFAHDGVNFFDIGSGTGGGTGVNVLTNGNFESGTATWTASAGSFDTTTASGDVVGGQTGRWDASASADTLRSDGFTIPNDLKGKACLASFIYKCSTCTSGHYSFQVLDGANAAITNKINLEPTLSTQYITREVSFVCPTSGQLKASFAAELSAPPEILLDSVHIGSDYRRGVVGDQAELIASQVFSQASCQWVTNSSAITPVAFTTTSACGPSTAVIPSLTSVANTDTDLPRVTFTNLPAGKYQAIFDIASFQTTTASAGIQLVAGIFDGTNLRGVKMEENFATTSARKQMVVMAEFEYTTSGSKTFELYGSCVGSSSACRVNAQNVANEGLYFKLYRFPNQSPRDTVTLETQGAIYTGVHGTNCAWQRANAAYGDFTADATCDFTTVTNTGFSTVTSALSGSDRLPGIVFTPPYAGAYQVCASFTQNGTVSNTTNIRLVDGSTVLNESQSGGTPTADVFDTVNLCGISNYTGISQRTFKLESKASSGSAEIKVGLKGNATIFWSIIPLTQQFPQAVALTELDPTKVTSGVAATKMGLKQYSCQGLTGLSGSGLCFTGMTISATNLSAIQRATFLPYQLFDGSWRLKFNLKVNLSVGAGNLVTTLGGVTFKNVSTFLQAISCSNNNTGAFVALQHAIPNTSQVRCQTGGTDSEYSYSGDVELESKPTWAD